MNEENQVIDEIGTSKLKNATATLVLGILSIIPGCFCFYGILGIVLGIIALSISAKDKRAYQENPSNYDQKEYKNMNAGRICAIIGLSLSALYFIAMVSILIMFGYEVMSDPDAMRDIFEQ